MADVQRCDACGDIRFKHLNEYHFGSRVTDVEANPDAVDIRPDGHLCNGCAFEVAELIKELDDDD